MSLEFTIYVSFERATTPLSVLEQALVESSLSPTDLLAAWSDNDREASLRVRADDPSKVVDDVRTALVERGHAPRIIEARDTQIVEAQAINAVGATYDIATGTLAIDGLAAGDIEIDLVGIRGGTEIRGFMSSTKHGRRVEDGLTGLVRITVRRPG